MTRPLVLLTALLLLMQGSVQAMTRRGLDSGLQLIEFRDTDCIACDATADALAAIAEHAAERKLLAQAIEIAERRLAAGDARHRRALPQQIAVLRQRLAQVAALPAS